MTPSVPGMEGRYSMLRVGGGGGGGGGGVSFFEDVPSVKFLSFVFTHIPDESYHR